MKAVFVRSAYNYDGDLASLEAGLSCADKSLAVQSAAEECDINTIVKRFGLTGQLPSGVRAPTYGDFTEVVDFQTAMNAIATARESFDTLPAHVRARFQNDPAAFVDFCSDDANRAEAVKLGLVFEGESGEESGGVVRSGAERVSVDAGSRAVRLGEGRADVSGGNAGSGTSPVQSVESAPPSGSKK